MYYLTWGRRRGVPCFIQDRVGTVSHLMVYHVLCDSGWGYVYVQQHKIQRSPIAMLTGLQDPLNRLNSNGTAQFVPKSKLNTF